MHGCWLYLVAGLVSEFAHRKVPRQWPFHRVHCYTPYDFLRIRLVFAGLQPPNNVGSVGVLLQPPSSFRRDMSLRCLQETSASGSSLYQTNQEPPHDLVMLICAKFSSRKLVFLGGGPLGYALEGLSRRVAVKKLKLSYSSQETL